MSSSRRMPTLGPPPKNSSWGKVLFVAMFVGVVAGGYWWRTHHSLPGTVIGSSSPAPGAASATAAQTSPSAPGSPAATPGTALAPATPSLSATDVAPKPSAVRHITVRIDGPLETAIISQAGPEVGPALAQVITRALVWWVEVPGDFRKGDKLDILFEERANEEPLVHAVRFESAKSAQTFRAYRFQPLGETFARFYQPNGDELELRLLPPPLDDYEQITSLIRDGRHHKGVDFKTPVGSRVRATFAGTITRKNWNFHGNGNCLEISETGTIRKALLLHLSELPKTLRVGERVTVGQVIAQSGNSGHSFAPHLHYQLMSGEEKVLDPFESQPTKRRSMNAEAKGPFATEVQRMDTLMSIPLAKN